jgi:hypothetical protein
MLDYALYLIHYLHRFTDTEDLYFHHRNNFDTIIRTRLADFPLNSGFIVCLLLIELRPHVGRRLVSNFTNYFSTVEGDFSRIYSTLYSHLQAPGHNTPNLSYSMLLTKFLTYFSYFLPANTQSFSMRLEPFCRKLAIRMN